MAGNWQVATILVLSTGLCSLAQDELEFLGKLQLAHVVYRHGARTPVLRYPSDPLTEEKWGVKFGQLTQLGKEQQYELGSYLRNHYLDFLPSLFDSDDVVVRCCDVDRILVSSELLMEGIFPPQAAKGQFVNVYWQSIPVHTVPEEHDMAELEKMNSSIEFQCFKNQMAFLEDFSISSSGVSAILLYDVLKSKSYHGVMLPFWSMRVFPQLLSEYSAWTMFFNTASTAPLRRMYVGKLLHEMLEHMEMKMEGSLVPDRKLFAYGGHDTNLLALLSSMKVWNGIIPPFSACIMVELRLNSKREHVVTVSYKNDTTKPPHLLKLPGCPSVACPFYDFVAAVDGELFDEAECQEVAGQALQPLVFHLPARHIPDEWKQCFEVV